ncbi:MAG: DNA topoisomerase VI subunit B [Pseudomonadota bacterium]
MAKKKQQPDGGKGQLLLNTFNSSNVVSIDTGKSEKKAKKKEEKGRSEQESTVSVLEPVAAPKQARKTTAEKLATKQRDISVAEFFTKNRHLLGFDNPARALLTTVKEAVDNALDACEEAGILPEVKIVATPLNHGERFRIEVLDNGPGIVKAQIPKIFGKLLYGSKFHTLKQARGQQGIGISAAGMYGQLTTGAPVVIISRIRESMPASKFLLRIDMQRNNPEILEEDRIDVEWTHGTSVSIDLEATYKKGPHSVDEYVELSAVANPHATIIYVNPDGEETRYERTSMDMPPETREMKPHPYGVELGMLLKIFQGSKKHSVKAMLMQSFSRVSQKVASEICGKAGIRETTRASKLQPEEVEAIHKSIREVKIMAPPSKSVAPIGEDLIIAGLKRKFDADYYFSCTRPPSVYRGNPFIIEAGIAYGGKLPADRHADVVRFANRVPLLYQKGACAITEGCTEISWRNYGLSQPSGSLPIGPLAIFVHMASAWVPFTSESKEAVAHYPEIIKEIKLALQECGRKLGMHISARKKEAEAERKRSYIEKYIPHIGIALRDILGLSEKEETTINATLKQMLEKKPV